MNSDNELKIAKLNIMINKSNLRLKEINFEIDRWKKLRDHELKNNELLENEKYDLLKEDLKDQPIRSFKTMEYSEKFNYATEVAKAHNVKRAVYSVFDFDFDEIAITGKATVRNWGWSDYSWSAEVENPTWLDLLILSDDMIEKIEDHHHVFLEGIYRDGTDNTGKTFILSMGS